jgi:hypothetical protein
VLLEGSNATLTRAVRWPASSCSHRLLEVATKALID